MIETMIETMVDKLIPYLLGSLVFVLLALLVWGIGSEQRDSNRYHEARRYSKTILKVPGDDGIYCPNGRGEQICQLTNLDGEIVFVSCTRKGCVPYEN